TPRAGAYDITAPMEETGNGQTHHRVIPTKTSAARAPMVIYHPPSQTGAWQVMRTPVAARGTVTPPSSVPRAGRSGSRCRPHARPAPGQRPTRPVLDRPPLPGWRAGGTVG